jgi:hypothetical protein
MRRPGWRKSRRRSVSISILRALFSRFLYQNGRRATGQPSGLFGRTSASRTGPISRPVDHCASGGYWRRRPRTCAWPQPPSDLGHGGPVLLAPAICSLALGRATAQPLAVEALAGSRRSRSGSRACPLPDHAGLGRPRPDSANGSRPCLPCGSARRPSRHTGIASRDRWAGMLDQPSRLVSTPNQSAPCGTLSGRSVS